MCSSGGWVVPSGPTRTIWSSGVRQTNVPGAIWIRSQPAWVFNRCTRLVSGPRLDGRVWLASPGRQCLRRGKIPFEVEADPFYSEANQAHLRAAVAKARAREGLVVKTLDELDAMADA